MGSTNFLNQIIRSIEKSWYQDDALPLLKPLANIYGLGTKIRPALYKSIWRPKAAEIPSVGIGNLTVGGSGKTPLTIALAKLLIDQNIKPAVLSRGYGRDTSLSSPPLKVSLGDGPLIEAKKSGDEPWLMAQSLPGLKVLVDPNRVRGAQVAKNDMGANFLILDDGFQQLALQVDCLVLLIPSDKPFGNGCLLPAGPLRESVDGHRRAHIIVCTGSDSPSEISKQIAQNRPLFSATYQAKQWRDHHSAACCSADCLNKEKVFAFCGLARPENFYNTLEKLGLRLMNVSSLADHQDYSNEILTEIGLKFLASGADVMVTTAKDAVKIPKNFSLPLKILDVDMKINKPDDFIRCVLNFTGKK